MSLASAVPAAPAGRLRTYASFVRFEHTLFSLPLILAGVFSVSGAPMSASRWALVAVAAVGARTAAMALNRLIDRRIDALNPRTQGRELPAGRMKPREAWWLLATSTIAYLLACAALGPLYLKLAPIPLAVFAAYPYLKRFTSLCHFGVGVALALAPLAGWVAAFPDLRYPEAPVMLAAFALAWVSGFDIIYATLDEGFDRTHGVKSLVARLGRDQALRVSAALHLVAWIFLGAALLMIAGGLARLDLARLPAAALWVTAGVLLWLEQRWAEDVNLAFFKVNVWVGLVVFAAVLAARLSWGRW
jgi:4-hydroxybenzoate polyprenyltransferase